MSPILQMRKLRLRKIPCHCKHGVQIHSQSVWPPRPHSSPLPKSVPLAPEPGLLGVTILALPLAAIRGTFSAPGLRSGLFHVDQMLLKGLVHCPMPRSCAWVTLNSLRLACNQLHSEFPRLCPQTRASWNPVIPILSDLHWSVGSRRA